MKYVVCYGRSRVAAREDGNMMGGEGGGDERMRL